MPTLKEMSNNWGTQYQLFGSNSIPQDTHDDDNSLNGGLSEQRNTDKLVSQKKSKGFSGPIVGLLHLDLANAELILK